MTTFWIDLNSFPVEAEDMEEAVDKAERMIKEKPEMAFPLEARYEDEVV